MIAPLTIWKLKDGRIVMVISVRRTCLDAGGRIKIVKCLEEKSNSEIEIYNDQFWIAVQLV
jgi:hypothetical protein